MRTIWIAALAATCAALAVGAQAAGNPGGYLANPAVRLWYEETGRLSGNIAPPVNFTLWNTIIGEGDAEEQANDALFTVELHTDGQQNITQPIVLTATDIKGKVLARRALTNALTSESGALTVPLWVRDVGCAGRVTFRAQYGASQRSVTLDFSCGE